MNINEYAGDYDIYQNHLSVDNAEAYLEERSNYENKIKNYEYLMENIKDIVFGDSSYGNSEQRIKNLKEVLEDV